MTDGHRSNASREPVVYRLSKMSGFAFEKAIATLFERLGYTTEIPGRTSDFGRDVIATSSDETIIIECKHTQSGVGRPVVQKLHSATLSFDDSARGIIVCTGGFSEPAKDHAAELGSVLKLWSYEQLVRRGRQVDVYFRSEAQGTDLVFEPSLRSDGDLEVTVRKHWADHIASDPRPPREVLMPTVTRSRRLPALRIRYRLDEQFGTSTYPNLHRVRDRGTLIVGVDTDVTPVESDYWSKASFDVRRTDPVDGNPPSALFGIDLDSRAESVKRKVARSNSTSVRYTGRNNQTYTKSCIVEPEDVETDVLQVFVPRQTLDLRIGPTSGRVWIAQERGRTPRVVESDEFDADLLRDIGDGEPAVLCNDCATLQREATAPRPCEECRRTLCQAHHWDHPPAVFGSARVLCADCYRDISEHSALSGSPLRRTSRAVLGALIPPVGLWPEGFRVGALLALFVPAGLVTTGLTAGTTQGPTLYAVAALVWVVAATAVLKRTSNVRAHHRNRVELQAYERDWKTDAS